MEVDNEFIKRAKLAVVVLLSAAAGMAVQEAVDPLHHSGNITAHTAHIGHDPKPVEKMPLDSSIWHLVNLDVTSDGHSA